MGTSSSADKRRQVKGGIFIQLQKTAFISNEVITGMLCINLEEQFQGHVLQIALEGLEETHYTYVTRVGPGNGKFKKHRRIFNATGLNQFLNFTIPVYDFAMGQITDSFVLQPGQWQIPFSLNVADKLPSSMTYFATQKTRCQLKYTLRASILSSDANVRPVQGQQEIMIGQQINYPQVPSSMSISSTPQICCCCCCSDGQINLKATANQMQYAPSETIKIQLDCDFSGYKNKVSSLTVSLTGSLVMKANKAVVIKEIDVYKQIVKQPVNGTKCTESLSITIPPNVNLTAQGDFIRYTYSIQVLPDIDTCCCVNENAPLIVPVMINPTKQSLQVQPFPQMMQVQAPANWNPTQLQQAQFTAQQTLYIQQQQAVFQQQEMALLNQQADMINTSQAPMMTAAGGGNSYL